MLTDPDRENPYVVFLVYVGGRWVIKKVAKAAVKKVAKESAKKASKGIGNAIPNFSKATIDPRKLTDYALNPNHPVGGNKAKVFESALGYNQSNASQLMKQIQKNLANTLATLGKADQYGQRYTVDILIKGANGKTATVRTEWIIKSGSNTPEMTTLFVK